MVLLRDRKDRLFKRFNSFKDADARYPWLPRGFWMQWVPDYLH